VDAGNLCGDDERQVPVVFGALKAMRYAATGLGRFDLRFLPAYVRESKQSGVPVVHIAAADIPDVAPYVVKQVGDVRVGIVSFGDADPKDDQFELKKRRYAAFAAARQACDVLVLLDLANVATDEWLQRNADRFGSPDLVIGGEARWGLFEPKVVGKTRIMPVCNEARYVGVAKVGVAPGQELKVGFTWYHLDGNCAEDPDVKKSVSDYVEATHKTMQTPMPPARSTQASSGTYYDSRTCAPCHKSEQDHWTTSVHAGATRKLIEQRSMSLQCLPCHSEKYRQTKQYSASDDQYNQGVECASCHIRVLPHGAGGPPKMTTAGIDLDTCRVCHTRERSPEFERRSKEYWDKAGHKAAKES